MKKWLVVLAAAGALAAGLIAAGTARVITPANGGDAGGTATPINDDPGDQTEPHVSGNLAVYTDNNDGTIRTIHYFDFATAIDRVVPAGALGDSDFLSDVDGNRIVFSRSRAADEQTGVMLFDVASGVVRQIDPQPVMTRFGAVIGANTVAYQELAFGNGDIFAYDLGTGTATNLTQPPPYHGDFALPGGGPELVLRGAEPVPKTCPQAARS